MFKYLHFKRLFVRLALLIFLGLGGILHINCAAQKQSLLALSKNDHILAIVDPVTFAVTARIPVGPDPHEVIASTDGKFAFVSNTVGGESIEINVIDLVAQKPLPNIDTRPLKGPHGLAYANGKMFFSAEGTKSVGRYDPVTNKVDWCMGTGQERTHMVYVSSDEKRIYTTNVNAGTVSILIDTILAPGAGPMGGPPPPNMPMGPPPGAQPHRSWLHTVIPVSIGSEGFDVSPDGKQLWTAAADNGSIAVIDLATKKLSITINAKILGANRLKFTPDGKRVLISSLRTGDLYIYDAVSQKELKRINIGHGGAGIEIEPNGARAFIGCTPDNYVAVIDLKTLEVIAHINIGGGPDGLAWAIQK